MGLSDMNIDIEVDSANIAEEMRQVALFSLLNVQ